MKGILILFLLVGIAAAIPNEPNFPKWMRNQVRGFFRTHGNNPVDRIDSWNRFFDGPFFQNPFLGGCDFGGDPHGTLRLPGASDPLCYRFGESGDKFEVMLMAGFRMRVQVLDIGGQRWVEKVGIEAGVTRIEMDGNGIQVNGDAVVWGDAGTNTVNDDVGVMTSGDTVSVIVKRKCCLSFGRDGPRLNLFGMIMPAPPPSNAGGICGFFHGKGHLHVNGANKFLGLVGIGNFPVQHITPGVASCWNVVENAGFTSLLDSFKVPSLFTAP